MQRPVKKRAILAAVVLLAGLFMAVYLENRPRIVPEQELLADTENIETLRTQFNCNAGKTRLIILVSPA